MRILEICPYSSGICGVWSRVKEESKNLTKMGNEVMVFSSDFVKGENKRDKKEDSIEGIKIKRFKALKLGGESFMNWNFRNEALKFKPDKIIVHCYRHLHTTKALKIGKELNAEVFLVTHAPFVKGDITRGPFSKLSVRLYDKLIGPRTINKFTNVITITKWELPYLENLGLSKKKIAYIPNGIPEEFFLQKKFKKGKNLLFLGRISPIKNLEVLIEAVKIIKNKEITLEIVGPKESEYYQMLKEKVSGLNLGKRVKFRNPIYDLDEKIKKMDNSLIFILPSKKEGLPQSLIEAMSRGKTVLCSNHEAGKDIINHGVDGYLFRNGDSQDLARMLEIILKEPNKNLGKNARQKSMGFRWSKISQELNNLLKK